MRGDAFRLIIESENDDFMHLVGLAGLDPSVDFRGADLSGVDFGYSDLRAFRFSGAVLDGADLSRARVTSETLAGANLTAAKLPSIERPRRYRVTTRVSDHTKAIIYRRFHYGRSAAITALAAMSRLTRIDAIGFFLQASRDPGLSEYMKLSGNEPHTTFVFSEEEYRLIRDLREEVGVPGTWIVRALVAAAAEAAADKEGFTAFQSQAVPALAVRIRRIASKWREPSAA